MHPTDWTSLHGDAFAGTKALVTGGAGFIGSHLCEALTKLGADVVVLDDLSGTDGSWSNLDGFFKGRRIEGSILNRTLLAEATAGCSLVFHQAAMGSVPASVKHPRQYQKVNVEGTLNVLEAARSADSRRVLFAASSSAYGDSPTQPKTETMPALPRSPYAATKVAGEALMQAYAISYAPGPGGRDNPSHAGPPGGLKKNSGSGPDTVCLRYFNIFGPRQNANSAYAAVIAAFAKALLAGERLVIYGDGEQSRDFTHVDNAVHANLLGARAPGRLHGLPYNVAGGRQVTVNELATGMAAALDKASLVPEHRPERAGDVKHSLADLAAARRAFGYEPIVDFDTGLADTVAWYAARVD
ncbi:MAG: NAD-dependent epimerase/dehydratase family protein [Planctomycetota bacterium]